MRNWAQMIERGCSATSTLGWALVLLLASCGSSSGPRPPYERDFLLSPQDAGSYRSNGDNGFRDSKDAGSDGDVGNEGAGRCDAPNAGCPCPLDQETVTCGIVREQYGDYLRCSEAFRKCNEGVWGECFSDRILGGN
jgi:hypothetical protein